MENHYFDAEGIYLGSAAANPGSVPPRNALRTPPPEKPGWWPVVDAEGTGWNLREDHRGKRGFVAGRLVCVEQLGPLPEGWMEEGTAARYFVSRSGVYHREGCRHAARGNGEWLAPDAVLTARPGARPCLQCRPGALGREEA